MRVPDLDRELTEENFGRTVDLLNTVLRNLTVLNNFSGQVIENIVVPLGQEIKIPHSLKVIPKYRILLRQNDVNSLIVDGTEVWTDKYITLSNKGAADTVITILVLRS